MLAVRPEDERLFLHPGQEPLQELSGEEPVAGGLCLLGLRRLGWRRGDDDAAFAAGLGRPGHRLGIDRPEADYRLGVVEQGGGCAS